jgi:glycosyltransferase involved in cell wall biosynthesis
MAENYPAMIQATWDFYGPKPWDYVVRNPSLLRRLERYVLPKLDGILVVSEPSQRRVAEIVQRKVPVWVVGNTPRLDVVYESRRSPLIEQLARHPGLVLLYVGHMDPKRGLDIFVRALPSIKKTDPRALAVIVGKGVMEPKLRALAKELGVEENLLLPGWVDQGDVPSLIAEADIGMIPHLLTEHTDTTIPNKIYDYMAQGKPVVVSQCATLKQIVEECGCGRVYSDRDPEALAAAVATLADAGLRAELGEAGRRAVHERYRWDQDALGLQAALGAVTSSQASAASPLPSTQA